MSLPKFMVVRSNLTGKYLSYGKGKASSRSSSLIFSHEVKRPNLDVVAVSEGQNLDDATKGLRSEKMAASEKTSLEFHLLKLEVQEAKTAPGFVHIRTCYNNKYLVRKSEESKMVVAEAHEAEEDQSKWSCTLFKPVFLGEVVEEEGMECVYGSNKHGIGMVPQKIQLIHVAMGEEYYVSESMELIRKKGVSPQIDTILTATDVTASAQLPKYVTFKCHDGSKYLGSPYWWHLNFQYDEMADQGVAMVNLSSGSGPTDVTIYCGNQTDGGDWTPTSDSDHIVLVNNNPWKYTPVKVNNYVALYSSYYQKFLQNDPNDNSRFVALSPNINEESQLQVGEPVLSRTILKINYDLDNARVYDTTGVTKITDSRSNHTDHQDTGSLSKEYQMTQTMKWEQSITVGISMSMSMTFGIPEVGFGGSVGLNFDISETCTWGEESTHSDTVTHVYNFDVPPMRKQTKQVVASRSSCDVPYTCDVEDLLVDGTTCRYTIPDCWFKGANDYDADENTYEEPITS